MEPESEIFAEAPSENVPLPEATSRLIGAGQHFSYFRIEHDGKYFFFKTFTEDTSFARNLLRREYDLGVGCDHPNIPHILLFGEYVKGKEGILMEYVDGRPLTEYISERPSLRERKKIFSQILDAVEYLHTKGIIHNDLKPDNILIKRTGNNVALIDFGLSDNDAHFLLKSPGFTTGYAAPELVNSRVSNAKSDIYSIGKIMALLFGNRYRRFIRKCLRENPAGRYASIQELRKAWEGRNLPYMGAALAFALILVVAAVWLFLDDKAERDRQLEKLGTELENQKSANALQKENFQRLQTSYREVNDSYHVIKENYQEMKDSLAESSKIAMAHENAIKEVIERFKAGLNKRMYATFDSIKLCSTWREMNSYRQLYNTWVYQYFNSYPKIADGEDLTATLSAILQANLEESNELFNTEISRLHQ